MAKTNARRPLAAIVLAVALAGAACASGSEPQAIVGEAGEGTTPTTTVVTTSTTTTEPPRTPTEAAPEYAVGRRTLTVVDQSRPTVGNAERDIEPADSRTIELLVLYPAADAPGAPEDEPIDDAEVAEGRFPLVEFSHGVTASGPAYEALLKLWAREGYVVVAPTFPMTSGAGAWANLQDYKNQPADVSFVLDEVLALNESPDDPLAGHLASDEIAVAGHSLGAITTFGFLDTCCPDLRIKAIIEMSGVRLPFEGGEFDAADATPTLLIHGEDDRTVPYAGSGEAYAALAGPRALVSFPDGGHTDVLFAEGFHEVTLGASLGFLDLYLRDDPTAWNDLAEILPDPSVATLVEDGGLPAPGDA